jgi:transposase
MTQGSAIPFEVRLIIIRMSTAFSPKEIAYWTDTSIRSVQHIIQTWKSTGRIAQKERKHKKSKLNLKVMEVGA